MNLKVWHIPQIPSKAFEVKVSSVMEGVNIMNVLADYDQFQLDNNIKGDYCNANGLLIFKDGEWADWCDEETGEDDPRQYLVDNLGEHL